MEKTKKKWHLIDLKGQVLGRAASKMAMILRGKDKASFCPHEDQGDFIVAINAKKIKLTGQKIDQKMYYRYTGYIGGIKEINAEGLLKRNPEEVIRRAVKGMLPKNTLGRHQLKKLKIYPGADHPHQAQTPETTELGGS